MAPGDTTVGRRPKNTALESRTFLFPTRITAFANIEQTFAIGAVNDIIQLPKRIARGFKNFQTAAACELAASYSSFQLLINSDHPQKTAKGLILLQI
jgi:hypothetical protein